jgi:hypothetical protein
VQFIELTKIIYSNMNLVHVHDKDILEYM